MDPNSARSSALSSREGLHPASSSILQSEQFKFRFALISEEG